MTADARGAYFFCSICCCRRLLQVERCAMSMIGMNLSGVGNERREKVTRV